MRNRYETLKNWSADSEQMGRMIIQSCDLKDKQTGTVYRDGACRVIDVRTGKPVVVGKGGTVPFKGETAYTDAQRLMSDLFWEAQR